MAAPAMDAMPPLAQPLSSTQKRTRTAAPQEFMVDLDFIV
jgi:hypothetical protein